MAAAAERARRRARPIAAAAATLVVLAAATGNAGGSRRRHRHRACVARNGPGCRQQRLRRGPHRGAQTRRRPSRVRPPHRPNSQLLGRQPRRPIQRPQRPVRRGQGASRPLVRSRHRRQRHLLGPELRRPRGPDRRPSGRFVANHAGDAHSCGLRADDTVICWGNNDDGHIDVPTSWTNPQVCRTAPTVMIA